MLKCEFCGCGKDPEKKVFLVAFPNEKAICNNCGQKLKKQMDEKPIEPLIA